MKLEDALDLALTAAGSAAITLSVPFTAWWQMPVIGLWMLFCGIFILARVTRGSIVRRMPPPIVHCTRCGTNLRVS